MTNAITSPDMDGGESNLVAEFGDQILERAREVAYQIEDRVRKVTAVDTTPESAALPTAPSTANS
jgi:hypothetical protein